MRNYMLGVATLPALSLLGTTILWWVGGFLILLEDHGLSFSARWRRGDGSGPTDYTLRNNIWWERSFGPVFVGGSGPTDYTLRNNIWWERSFGPVFVGGWYREQNPIAKGEFRYFTRWVGLGKTSGPCLCAFFVRDVLEKS